ncbi:hypothetical protein HKD37_01G000663 [Glycine soja]
MELMEEKQKKRLEQAAQFGSTKTNVDPPSPIGRHVKWKMACTKKFGKMTSEAAREIANRIEIVRKLTQYFIDWKIPLKSSQHRATLSAMEVRMYLLLPLEYQSTLVVPVLLEPDPDVGESENYGLYIDDNPPRLVSLGRVYEGSATIHNIPLGNDQVKVGVEEVQDVDAPVLVPIKSVHWQLVIICPKDDVVAWFCSMHNKSKNYLKGIINSALKGFNDIQGSKSKATAKCILVKCNKQRGSIECGYCVMHWMPTIILGDFKDN